MRPASSFTAIGFYQVNNFTISNITIDGATMYNMAIRSRRTASYRRNDEQPGATLNSDGVSLVELQNIHVYNNNLDDGRRRDLRLGIVQRSAGRHLVVTASPIPTKNIEVDHNNVDVQCAGGCHGFLFINWTGATRTNRRRRFRGSTCTTTRSADVPDPASADRRSVDAGPRRQRVRDVQKQYANRRSTAARSWMATFAGMPKTDFSGDADFAGITSSTTLLEHEFRRRGRPQARRISRRPSGRSKAAAGRAIPRSVSRAATTASSSL